jgi:hypothetical protein
MEHRAERTPHRMTSHQRNDNRTSSSRRSAPGSPRARSDHSNAKARYAKYVELARAAALTGDVVETENYNQHAEHYFRMMREPEE